MKKKIIGILTCGVIVFGMVGCGGSSSSATTENVDNSDVQKEDRESETASGLSGLLGSDETIASITDPEEYIAYADELIHYVYQYIGYLSSMESYETGQLMHDSIDPSKALANALSYIDEDKGIDEEELREESLQHINEAYERLQLAPEDEACQEILDTVDYFVDVYVELYTAAIKNMEDGTSKDTCKSALSSAGSAYLQAAKEYKSYIGEEEEEYVFEEYDFGDELEAYQGTWKKANSSSYVVINGDTINSVHEITIKNRTTRTVHTFYFGYDDDGNLIVRNQYGQPRDNISLIDDENLIYDDDTYYKFSDDTDVPNEIVDPEIGMSKAEVLASSWGSPKKRNVTETTYSTTEQWVYEDGYIYFTDGVVTTIQE